MSSDPCPICKFVHTYVHTYTHTHIHTYIHAYVHTYMLLHSIVLGLDSIPVFNDLVVI